MSKVAGHTEASIQREIMEYLRARGCMVFRMNADRGRQNQRLAPAGTPDLLVLDRYGRTIWLEVKGPDGRLREEQLTMHKELFLRDQEVVTVRSLDEVMELWD